MTVIIKNRLSGGKLAVYAPRSRCAQEKIFVDEFHKLMTG
jgi:hypothetical protein